VFERAGAAGKFRVFDFYTGFDRAHTVFAGLLGGAFLSMASHGADQIIVQRLLASNNLPDARKALIGSGVVVIAQFVLFMIIGIGLWAYYDARQFASSDAIFPQFIIEVMPPGLTGLVIAAILAAAMSTVSGSLNSLAAATTHDIYAPLSGKTLDENQLLVMAKRFTLVWAFILIGGALLYRQQGTPVVIIALAIASFTYGGLLGGFFLGMLWSRARQRDAILGMSVGIGTMALIVFAPQLAPTLTFLRPIASCGPKSMASCIAFPWYVLIGTAITMTVGIASSYIGARPPARSTTT
jgi:Na+/proline symporter